MTNPSIMKSDYDNRFKEIRSTYRPVSRSDLFSKRSARGPADLLPTTRNASKKPSLKPSLYPEDHDTSSTSQNKLQKNEPVSKSRSKKRVTFEFEEPEEKQLFPEGKNLNNKLSKSNDFAKKDVFRSSKDDFIRTERHVSKDADCKKEVQRKSELNGKREDRDGQLGRKHETLMRSSFNNNLERIKSKIKTDLSKSKKEMDHFVKDPKSRVSEIKQADERHLKDQSNGFFEFDSNKLFNQIDKLLSGKKI